MKCNATIWGPNNTSIGRCELPNGHGEMCSIIKKKMCHCNHKNCCVGSQQDGFECPACNQSMFATREWHRFKTENKDMRVALENAKSILICHEKDFDIGDMGAIKIIDAVLGEPRHE